MSHSYWGPEYGDAVIAEALAARRADMEGARAVQRSAGAEEEVCRATAAALAAGRIVGWFQGRMEWGPRALGNRSILADPRRADVRDVLNAKIKRRELFRPFAPSILEERVAEYFEQTHPSPFMLLAYRVRPEARDRIPATTHVDGTGRLQTVHREQNPRFHRLIREFDRLTGVPVLLNTSFNENEPVVCEPAQAIDCFLRTEMDVLVLGDRILERVGAVESRALPSAAVRRE
jgi:carbamoyltransferase